MLNSSIKLLKKELSKTSEIINKRCTSKPFQDTATNSFTGTQSLKIYRPGVPGWLHQVHGCLWLRSWFLGPGIESARYLSFTHTVMFWIFVPGSSGIRSISASTDTFLHPKPESFWWLMAHEAPCGMPHATSHTSSPATLPLTALQPHCLASCSSHAAAMSPPQGRCTGHLRSSLPSGLCSNITSSEKPSSTNS